MSAHVAVLSGGISLEREVSLRSGRRVADALTDRGYQVTRLDVDADLVKNLADADVEVVFLTLHGSAGEDGTIQSMLEVLEIPYTGPDVLASALAWNKPIAQGIYARRGMAVPPFVTLSQQAFREMGAAATVNRIADELGTPLVVKPAQGGSSLGLSFVSSADELPQAIVGAFSYASAVLIERQIEGTEVAVTVLDGEPLPVVEIQPKEGAYDFEARYTAGATEFHVPARLDDGVAARCKEVAHVACEAVGARHISRADMIVSGSGVTHRDHEFPAGTPFLLELDTCPGLTDTSLVPQAAQAAGMEFGELCERIVSLALEAA
ncbi:MAG: D-alanine--D-alanine ligase [Nitriliruptorales bacterium]|nr:D-alanine--D-alanine ligase [Nitriliruptorales bacterium]